MVTASKIAQSFNSDALRLADRAHELLKRMKAQVSAGQSLAPAHVNAFYQVVHTLKGTASMLGYGVPIVRALEEVEGRLATRSLDDSAKNPGDWLDLGLSAIEKIKASLEKMGALTPPRRARGISPVTDAIVQSDKGLFVQVQVSGKKRLLWFPVSCLIRVFTSQELQGKDVMSLNGAWVPVIGKSKVGLGIHTPLGQAIVTVDEVLNILTWSEASGLGALSGPELLMPKAA